MPAHIKCALTSASLTIPIQKGQLYMGTWQGIWLMEYRTQKHTRSIVVTINGQQYSKN
jgi:secondary thiamine-phosphate synthase enzyme